MNQVLALLVLLAGEATASDAVTRYVGTPDATLQLRDVHPEGPWYGTPQEALAAASDGDTLVIVGGEYEGRLNVQKSVRILGVGPELPVFHDPVRVVANHVVLDRLHLVGGTTAGVLFQNVQGGRVGHCRFSECQQGITVRGSDRVIVEDNHFLYVRGAVNLNRSTRCVVRRNTVQDGSWRVFNIEASPSAQILDNHILEGGWVGILVISGSDGVTIQGNTVQGGQVGINVHTDRNRIENNVIRTAHHGVYLGRSPFGRAAGHGPYVDEKPDTEHLVVPSGNTVRGNHFLDCKREGVLLKDAKGTLVEDNEFRSCRTHAIVQMRGCEDNRFEGNRFEGTGDARGPRADVRDLMDPDGKPDRWRLSPSPDGSAWNLAFGDFHNHSLLSDGGNHPDEILEYARDVLALDFCALSEHAEDLVQREPNWTILDSWAEEFSEPGVFIAWPGYETTYAAEWWGHYNVYFPGRAGRVYPAPHGGAFGIPRFDVLTPFELLQRLAADGVDHVILRHHYFKALQYWEETPEDPVHLPMTEVSSVHAIWSGDPLVDDFKTRRTHESEGMFSTMRGALEAGRVIGVGAGSDSHYGFPSDYGLTVALVGEMTDEWLLDAVRQRRTYATTGARIEMAFTVDGRPMGSNLTEAPRAFRFVVHGTHELEEVVLFGPRGMEIRGFLQGTRCSVSRSFPEFAEGEGFQPGDYFRVRVKQKDGEMAWSTPIWYRATPATGPTDAQIADKTAMSLMMYTANLRTWPDQLRDGLERRSPRVAMLEDEWRAVVMEHWPAVEQCVAEIQRRGRDLGLDQEGALDRVRSRFEGRLDFLPAAIRAELDGMAWPLIEVRELRETLGF